MSVRNFMQRVKLLAYVLVAFAQLLPPGYALTPDSDGFSLVICTVDGEESVSWEDYFGDALPKPPPSEKSEHNPCHACVTSCRAGALEAAVDGPYSHPAQLYTSYIYPEARTAVTLFRVSPPMPSRSPPLRTA